MSLKKSFSAPCYKAFCRRNQSQSSQRCSLTSCFNDTGGKCYLKFQIKIFIFLLYFTRLFAIVEILAERRHSYHHSNQMERCLDASSLPAASCWFLQTSLTHLILAITSYCTQLPAALNSFSLSVGKSLKLIQRFRLSSEVVPHVIKYPHLHKNAA